MGRSHRQFRGRVSRSTRSRRACITAGSNRDGPHRPIECHRVKSPRRSSCRRSRVPQMVAAAASGSARRNGGPQARMRAEPDEAVEACTRELQWSKGHTMPTPTFASSPTIILTRGHNVETSRDPYAARIVARCGGSGWTTVSGRWVRAADIGLQQPTHSVGSCVSVNRHHHEGLDGRGADLGERRKNPCAL
jgi:hypothetical protein